jgi:APA family basic amino acid/polyamine antiporter
MVEFLPELAEATRTNAIAMVAVRSSSILSNRLIGGTATSTGICWCGPPAASSRFRRAGVPNCVGFPRQAALRFMRDTFSPLAGFLWGWAMFWTMHTGIIARSRWCLRVTAYFAEVGDTGIR